MLSVKPGMIKLSGIAIILILLISGWFYFQKPAQVVVGIINTAEDLDKVVSGFKTSLESKMAGKKIQIINFKKNPGAGSLDDFLEYLLSKKPDVIVTLTTPITAKVKKKFAGTKTPIIFGLVVDPVGSGFVSTFKRPGGELTGIRADSYELKRLEWVMKIFPGLKTIHVNFNPEDKSMAKTLELLKAAAESYQLKLSIAEYNSHDSLMNSLNRLPENHRLIWQLPSPDYSEEFEAFIQKAGDNNKIVISHLSYWVKKGGLMTYGISEELLIEQLTAYTLKIISGISPAVIPVEHCETHLALNLSTARNLGIHIPVQIVSQAEIIH